MVNFNQLVTEYHLRGNLGLSDSDTRLEFAKKELDFLHANLLDIPVELDRLYDVVGPHFSPPNSLEFYAAAQLIGPESFLFVMEELLPYEERERIWDNLETPTTRVDFSSEPYSEKFFKKYGHNWGYLFPPIDDDRVSVLSTNNLRIPGIGVIDNRGPKTKYTEIYLSENIPR
ncbi:hypothetical protein GOV11_05185 [Candidatus Woesearchaeota archaeon]|nr:hypothetical protein [Candidatus Woesearchaeota archaeon]